MTFYVKIHAGVKYTRRLILASVLPVEGFWQEMIAAEEKTGGGVFFKWLLFQ
ncbi:hypothetical protein DCCM_0852 [Desulfocucumis palustris]|uniref:Uncharacterized protein n=1 Tax=Desulfocucumis palustris TaxID=1898651 RepID=A0A2L2XEI2_9FIRM|nr:hypothetical protein DCCM_0852 [Desulfocucumis palustris]